MHHVPKLLGLVRGYCFLKKPINVPCPPFFAPPAGFGAGLGAGLLLLVAPDFGSALLGGSTEFDLLFGPAAEVDLTAFAGISPSDSPE